MARILQLSEAEENQIKKVWEKIVLKYPELNREDFPLDYNLNDFLDDVRLNMTPDF